MHKVALSLVVIAASGAYVWDQSRQQQAAPIDAMLASTAAPPAAAAPLRVPAVGEAVEPKGATATDCAPATPTTSPAQALAAAPTVAPETVPAEALAAAPAPTETAPAQAPAAVLPRARPKVTTAAMTTVGGQGMADGSFTGPTTDAYYGPMQFEAVVKGGRLLKLRALQYPSDRRTSIAINRQALPMLANEAIVAQSADVDIVTGATLTSRAFIRSLAGALAQASQ